MTPAAFKERPILFSGPSVRAILGGRKSQTRRVCRVQPMPVKDGFDLTLTLAAGCPYGKPGDRLWVRESGWERPDRSPRAMREGADTWPEYIYSADDHDAEQLRTWRWKRRPSIHMPRWASRITLVVRSVCVNRLQDITDAEARAEGMPGHPGAARPSRLSWAVCEFADLWNNINGARGYHWDSNPWVWVIAFERVIS